MLTSDHTLFQSSVRLSLTEECFLMSTQISYLLALQRDTSALPHVVQTQSSKYIVTEVRYLFPIRPTESSSAFGRNGQGSNPCKDAF